MARENALSAMGWVSLVFFVIVAAIVGCETDDGTTNSDFSDGGDVTADMYSDFSGDAPADVPADVASDVPTTTRVAQRMLLIREESATGEAEVMLGDTEGGSLVNVTDTAAAFEQSPCISDDGYVCAFERNGSICISDGIVETCVSSGSGNQNPCFNGNRLFWSNPSGFVGIDLETDQPVSLGSPPSATFANELTFAGDGTTAACTALVLPVTVSKIWVFDGTSWRALQSSADADEQFFPRFLPGGTQITYNFTDGGGSPAGIRIANVSDGAITDTIAVTGVYLIRPTGFIARDGSTDICYGRTEPASICTYDLDTETETCIYDADTSFIYTSPCVAIGTGDPANVPPAPDLSSDIPSHADVTGDTSSD